MHCQLLTQYAIIMAQFLAGLRKIKLQPGPSPFAHATYIVILIVCQCLHQDNYLKVCVIFFHFHGVKLECSLPIWVSNSINLLTQYYDQWELWGYNVHAWQ